MKNLKYFSLLMAAGMFAACSDNLNEVNGGDPSGGVTTGTGFVKVAINLPSTSSVSRADDGNDNFNDGIAEEYKVNNVILALFYGDYESDAKCTWAVNLNNIFNNNASNNDNITTKSEFVLEEIPKPTNNIYALAIINNSGYFNVTTGNKLQYSANGSITATGEGSNEFSGTLADLFTTVTTVDIAKIADATTSAGNFMMTNAPISDISSVTSPTSWSPKVTTLVKLNFFDSKASADAAQPNPIYVERVAAKVNVKVKDEATDNTLAVSNTEAFPNAKVKFTGWTLQNTNKLTYLVRKVNRNTSETDISDINDWVGYYNTNVNKENRFIGTVSDPYRTYWGIDPNYTIIGNDKLEENFNIIKKDADGTPSAEVISWKDLGTGVGYCAENTTTYKAMSHNQLTGVLLQANFYISDNNVNQSFYTCNNSNEIYTAEQIIAAFTEVLSRSEDTKLGDNETITIEEGTDGAGAVIDSAEELLKYFNIPGTADMPTTRAYAILGVYNTINYYKDGKTYYYASLIKHFGDVYTPIASNEKINKVTDYNDEKHLGRWGVLRNNWYELVINSVSGPGEPEIPKIPTDPADKEKYYIKCDINILSWAKRSQGVDL